MNYPKHSLKQYTSIISQQLWIRNSGKLSCVILTQGLSQGYSQNTGQDYEILTKVPLREALHSNGCLQVSENLLPNSFIWLMAGLKFLLAVDWKHQFLATWSSPQGSSQ